MINLKSCPVETQRYFALIDWVKKLPWLVWSGNSLKTYFDGIISQAFAYKEKIGFVKTTLRTVNNTILIKNDQFQSSLIINSNDFKMKFINGMNFETELGWTLKADRITYVNNDTWRLESKYAINMVNFTFYNNRFQSMLLDPSILSKNGASVSINQFNNDMFVEIF